MRNRHLSRLTGNTRYSYLFTRGSTNSTEMKTLDAIEKPKYLKCFVSPGGILATDSICHVEEEGLTGKTILG